MIVHFRGDCAGKPNTDRVAALLSNNKPLSILKILNEINQITRFNGQFHHHSLKHVKRRPRDEVFIASLLSQGTNMGTWRFSNTSKGITLSELNHVVTWYFSSDVLERVNNHLIEFMHALPLPLIHQEVLGKTHSSSDGQKKSVLVESLNANASYKYFGTGKGVSIYSFIDERGALFYSTVISSAEREAGFVLDGLMDNTVIKTDLHSTDTHGFSEIIFALMHLLGLSFAPRIAKLNKQLLYAFKPKKVYQAKGHTLLPDHRIDPSIIREQWDTILRVLVSIRLKECRPSHLLKRLNSYASEHPLYKALQEFGRIIKSLFLLTYMNDVRLRQAIQKQLNKIELSHKFSDAIFFGNNQAFIQSNKEDQDMAVGCKRLIQNAIILWNYLTLSQKLLACQDADEKKAILAIIKNGSMMVWQHINMYGEYDFFAYLNSPTPFELPAILQLQLS